MAFELTNEFLDEIILAIEESDNTRVKSMISNLHAADIAEIFDELETEKSKYLFHLLDEEKASDVLVQMEEDVRLDLIEELPSKVVAQHFVKNMDSDDAADIIADLTSEKKEEIFSHIKDDEQAGDIVDLLHYDEDTAGGLMAKELISVNDKWDVNRCIDEIRKQAEEVDEVYNVYVIDDNLKLKGVLSLKKLVLSSPVMKVCDICKLDDVHSVTIDTKSEDVASIMEKYDLVSIPVIDNIGRLMGRITIDDVVDVIREEAEKDYQLISGISSDVDHGDSPWLLTKARLPWLLIGLVGGILGSRVIAYYEVDLGIYPEMIFFLPLIAAMGGNVGVQSSAIIVQGLANNSISNIKTLKKLLNEFFVALINGLVCAGLMFAYNLMVSDSLLLTATVSISLLAVIIFASLFGTFVPLALNRFKIDPALATGPFITTVNDIMGLFIYLMFGRIIFSIFI
jgi:magnesium transporter